MKTHDNPWNLTPAQSAAMDAVCEEGCQKLAARKLGLALKTVEAHCSHAGARMGLRTSLRKYLEWDRWMRRRAQGSQQ